MIFCIIMKNYDFSRLLEILLKIIIKQLAITIIVFGTLLFLYY